MTVEEVPVSSRSLSQEIQAAVWTFGLAVETGSAPDWPAAVEAITAADQLIWNDTDKKGRPRQRDCRSSLLSLLPLSPPDDTWIELRLEAAVDDMGRSLRPLQIQHWLSEQIGAPLRLQDLCRDELRLAQC